ncbi:MAG: hypothetical protein J6T10_21580 [Methanobrevibacter sp.]|nr:hypothetical protein [Methanobrevibacter sp.]
MKDILRGYITIYKSRGKDNYKNISKEERARKLNNIICPRCKYQNHEKMVSKYGKCNLCGATLSKDYFKKKLLRRIHEKG